MKILIKKNEIRTLLNLPHNCEIELEEESLAQAVLNPVSHSIAGALKTITVTFPELTAKDIVKQCANKVESGKLLYGDWYKKEDFYTKETTRPGTRIVNVELLHNGKSWNEIKNMGMEDNMLNFAETVYLLKESKEFRDMLRYGNDSGAWWTWSTTRASDGRLVYVGDFGDGGADVDRDSPGSRDGALGVSFSRSEPMNSAN